MNGQGALFIKFPQEVKVKVNRTHAPCVGKGASQYYAWKGGSAGKFSAGNHESWSFIDPIMTRKGTSWSFCKNENLSSLLKAKENK